MFLARSDVLAIPSSAVNQISGEESSFIDHKTRVFDRLAPEFEIALFPPVAVGYGRASEVLSPPRNPWTMTCVSFSLNLHTTSPAFARKWLTSCGNKPDGGRDSARDALQSTGADATVCGPATRWPLLKDAGQQEVRQQHTHLVSDSGELSHCIDRGC
jgi:hypothetical protein